MDDLFDRLKSALADRYAIERELGRGGMSVVFLARDLKHGRDVALKCLLPDVTAALGSDRFLREIRVTAKLQHPHILALYDSGEADGLLYYVMPLVEGESLRQRLNRVPPPRLDEVLQITHHVASALDYAHRHSVLHRDIKPENILLSDGHAIVADFGIAKAVSASGGQNLTRSGFPLGTPGYMSPEQAASVANLDEQTDVYSLACVAYEMLVGDRPGEWPSEESVTLGRFVDAPAEHREQLDRMPGRIEQVLLRGLATRRNKRYSKPLEFFAALAVAAERKQMLRDSEVRQVLQRAAELDAEHDTDDTALSLGAVEQAAAEVGIPPERVREAVDELNRMSDSTPGGQASKTPGFFNAVSNLVVERTTDGAVTRSDYAVLVREIHAALGVVGHGSTVGKTFLWSAATPEEAGRNVQVTVRVDSTVTRIRIQENLRLTGDRIPIPLFGATGGGLLGLVLGAGLGLGHSLLIMVPAAFIGVVGFKLTARSLIMGAAQQRRPQLEALGDHLVALVKNAPGFERSSSSTSHRPAVQ